MSETGVVVASTVGASAVMLEGVMLDSVGVGGSVGPGAAEGMAVTLSHRSTGTRPLITDKGSSSSLPAKLLLKLK